LLATIVPQLRDEQARWFAMPKLGPDGKHPDNKVVDTAPVERNHAKQQARRLIASALQHE
jgi:hypothetical protein